MYQIQPVLTDTFIVKNHNTQGVTQVSDANRAVFASEVTLNTAIGATVAAKDLPYLTMNDKVFAARYTQGPVLTPLDVLDEDETREVEEDEEEHKHKKHSGK